MPPFPSKCAADNLPSKPRLLRQSTSFKSSRLNVLEYSNITCFFSHGQLYVTFFHFSSVDVTVAVVERHQLRTEHDIKISPHQTMNTETQYGLSLKYINKSILIKYHIAFNCVCVPGGSVGIATGYGLDGPGIESRWGWGARFSATVQTGPGAHPASCKMGTGSFPGVKSGRGVTLIPHPLLVPLVMKE